MLAPGMGSWTAAGRRSVLLLLAPWMLLLLMGTPWSARPLTLALEGAPAASVKSAQVATWHRCLGLQLLLEVRVGFFKECVPVKAWTLHSQCGEQHWAGQPGGAHGLPALQ